MNPSESEIVFIKFIYNILSSFNESKNKLSSNEIKNAI